MPSTRNTGNLTANIAQELEGIRIAIDRIAELSNSHELSIAIKTLLCNAEVNVKLTELYDTMQKPEYKALICALKV